MTNTQTKIDLSEAMIGCVSLSTGHIPEHTARALGMEEGDEHPHDACKRATLWDLLTYEPWGTYGWTIWCSDEQAQVARNYEHEELANLIEVCVAKGVCMLNLDADAIVVDGLPTFEW